MISRFRLTMVQEQTIWGNLQHGTDLGRGSCYYCLDWPSTREHLQRLVATMNEAAFNETEIARVLGENFHPETHFAEFRSLRGESRPRAEIAASFPDPLRAGGFRGGSQGSLPLGKLHSTRACGVPGCGRRGSCVRGRGLRPQGRAIRRGRAVQRVAALNPPGEPGREQDQ